MSIRWREKGISLQADVFPPTELGPALPVATTRVRGVDAS